ncbi:MAG: hypothetical protein JSV96_10480 [Candidatus Aminicenantes bacterium]|nr:MAG: hypothetical protein JSV96_10480 [Candidatus Aminicenantes bacterium]
MGEATFEDLAFLRRALRESGGAGHRVCLSVASYAGAEKSDDGMALKI